jgi:hypothetical protein
MRLRATRFWSRPIHIVETLHEYPLANADNMCRFSRNSHRYQCISVRTSVPKSERRRVTIAELRTQKNGPGARAEPGPLTISGVGRNRPGNYLSEPVFLVSQVGSSNVLIMNSPLHRPDTPTRKGLLVRNDVVNDAGSRHRMCQRVIIEQRITGGD